MLKSKHELPQYATSNGFDLTFEQLRTIFPRWKNHPVFNGSQPVRIAKTKDGRWWAEWRGDIVFWASRWYELPKAVGERAERINQFIETYNNHGKSTNN